MSNLTHKKEQKQETGDKDGEALYNLMNNAEYGNTLEHVRNGIDISVVSNQKVLSKMDIKTKEHVKKN